MKLCAQSVGGKNGQHALASKAYWMCELYTHELIKSRMSAASETNNNGDGDDDDDADDVVDEDTTNDSQW